MSLLTILYHPDVRLRKKAVPVQHIDALIQRVIDDMFETMYAEKGIGLAATQVNIHQQIIVMDLSEGKSEPMCLINPEIIRREGSIESDEGCLSVPDYYDKVTRSEKIWVRALNSKGESLEFEADDVLAVCIQHEMDHLQGKLFVDYLSTLKQQRVRKRLEKWEKEQQQNPGAKRRSRAAIG